MRTARWILLLNVLMFVTSIWFVLAGARGEASAAPAPEPVATVKQLMDGIVAPASDTVYRSVSIIISAEGCRRTTRAVTRSGRSWRPAPPRSPRPAGC